jgi:hypothetical protein
VALVQKALVRCTLNADGSIGAVLTMSREEADVVGFECGGKHKWQKQQEAAAAMKKRRG